LIKIDDKDIYNVIQYYYVKQMLFFWTFYSSWKMHLNIKQHSSSSDQF